MDSLRNIRVFALFSFTFLLTACGPGLIGGIPDPEDSEANLWISYFDLNDGNLFDDDFSGVSIEVKNSGNTDVNDP